MELDALTDDVHRQILGFLPPDLFDFTDLAAGVAKLEAMFGATPVEIPEGVSVDDRTIASLDGHQLTVRLYRPSGAAADQPAIYWMHGGGLVMGGVSLDDGPCSAMALELGIVVASVDYRVAPAWPYPTPLDDCFAGYEWLTSHAEELGVDPARIAIGGNSAGAGLAAALALRLRDGGGAPAPCFQLLRYPMLDHRNITASSMSITDGRVWNRAANIAGWNAYLGGLVDGDVPAHASPARADDLSGLPPAIVTVGGLDLFLDEDIAYARALMSAGVPTELHVYPAAFHASNVMVPHADASQQMLRDEMFALRRALAR